MGDAELLTAAAQLVAAQGADATLGRATLSFQRCSTCGFVRHPSAPICPECLGQSYDWHDDEGLGTVWSTCTYHRAFDPAFEAAVPYNVVLVELDSGPRLISNVLGVPPDLVRVGMRVAAVTKEVAPARFLVYFEPAPEGR